MRGRLAMAVLVAVTLLAACTPAPRPPGAGTDLAAGPGGTGPDGPTVSEGGVPVDPATGQPITTDGTGGAGPGGAGGTAGAGGGPGATAGPDSTVGAGAPARSTLFRSNEDRVGINDTEIVICAHAALTYGAAFNTGEEDLNVYFDDLNARGGVHGRKVRVTYENDNYSPDTAVQAATACRDNHRPFFIVGGIGFDQIPAVRTWAEQNRQLYIHHTATKQGADNLRFSYTPLPTTERTGEMFGHLAATRYAGKKVGILKRGSENWEPGIKGFKEVAKERGVKISIEREVQVNKGNYLGDIVDLRNAGSEVVFIWLNALESVQAIRQIKSQGWHPNLMIFPFNLVSQTLGQDAMNPPLTGVSMHQAYSFGERDGPFAAYADDIKEFEQMYQRRRPNADIRGLGGDLLFLNWSAQKGLHKFLEICGRDCTRNRLVDLFSGARGKLTSSACDLDYSRPGPGNSHRGGWKLSVMEAYNSPSGRVNFRNTHTCVERL